MQGFCQADAPGTSIHLTNIIKQTRYQNPNGVVYYENYLELHQSGSGVQENLGTVGPIYVFFAVNKTLGQPAAIYLRKSRCDVKPPVDSEKQIFDQILSTFKFTQ